MNGQMEAERDPSAVIDRLVQSVNDHDLETLVACFDERYINETPVHPQRGFRGSEQVRRNWSQILAAVPEIRARVLGKAVDADEVWTEWEMSGMRRDGAAFLMAGVVIFCVTDAIITSARFYLEPVEATSGDVNAAVSSVVGESTAGSEVSGGSP